MYFIMALWRSYRLTGQIFVFFFSLCNLTSYVWLSANSSWHNSPGKRAVASQGSRKKDVWVCRQWRVGTRGQDWSCSRSDSERWRHLKKERKKKINKQKKINQFADLCGFDRHASTSELVGTFHMPGFRLVEYIANSAFCISKTEQFHFQYG